MTLIYPHGLQVMLDCMRRFQRPLWGYPVRRTLWSLSRMPSILRTPMPGISLVAACSAMDPCRQSSVVTVSRRSAVFRQAIRRDALWLTLARHFGVVLMPLGLTWWRRHDGQEYALGHRTLSYAAQGFEILQAALKHADCPLTQDQRQLALRAVKTGHALELLVLARRVSVRQALEIAQTSSSDCKHVARVDAKAITSSFVSL